jgi:hypothetical protein
MFHQLTEHYAQRARQFSDAVAHLGRYPHIEPGVLKLVLEIKRKHDLCVQAEEELLKYIDAKTAFSAAAH